MLELIGFIILLMLGVKTIEFLAVVLFSQRTLWILGIVFTIFMLALIGNSK